MAATLTVEQEDQLIDYVMGFEKDPKGFVLAAFDWGQEELRDHKPDPWQLQVLDDVGSGLLTVKEAIQIAVASGHGIGKTALVAWLILWSMSTCVDCRGVVTANTEIQLRTKTWAEVGKWHRLLICKHWFFLSATAIYSQDPEHEKTWRIDAIPWSEHNSEAFAGLHNQGRRILLIFDEASKIADKIWEVAEGALTDTETEIIWVAFGNPTRNVGRFRECFRRYRHRWQTRNIDSRSVCITNKDQTQRMIDDYGIDSDIVKVRVLGQFPAQSDRQFISSDLVDAAKGKHLRINEYNFAPIIIGCDPAWTGGDETVIYLRQGLYSSILKTVARNDDDVMIANFLARFEDEHNADAVFIDQGYGQGIYSAGKAMGRQWVLVSFGSTSMRDDTVNKRDEMWQNMKDWLKEGGAIPDDQVLADDLIGVETIPRLDGKIKLESKDDMKAKGVPSPNRADALALTFAYPVKAKGHDRLHKRNLAQAEKYNPFKRR